VRKPRYRPPGDSSRSTKRGFRGTPPPATFTLEGVSDDACLTEFQVGALIQVSTNSLSSWRREPDHPLHWFALPNGLIRYRVGALRNFLAGGRRRVKKTALTKLVPDNGSSQSATPDPETKPKRPRGRPRKQPPAARPELVGGGGMNIIAPSQSREAKAKRALVAKAAASSKQRNKSRPQKNRAALSVDG